MAAKKSPAKRPVSGTRLLGLGLDGQDGHRRITQGQGFLLAGGSEATHERMAETVIRTSEDLAKKGRDIASAAPQEVIDLLHKHGDRG